MAKAQKKDTKVDEKKMTKEEIAKEKAINKNAPIYTFEVKVDGEEEGSKKTYKIEIKKPTRSFISEADMHYSIQLSYYIKKGLLTAEQIAKRQVDIGGTFSEEQQKHYAQLQSMIAEKQEMFLKLMAKGEDLSPDEQERKKNLYDDMAMLRSQTMDYEYIKNQVYEHTANAKARNDVILWWVLNLANIGEVVDGKETVMAPMFAGENYETKKLKLDEMEDAEDEIVKASFAQMVKVITLWYWIGISDRAKLAEMLNLENDA